MRQTSDLVARTLTDSAIIHVRFFNPPFSDGRGDFFFGSKSAIFQYFNAETIGCNLLRLWRARIGPNKAFTTNRCTIKNVPLYRIKQTRLKDMDND